MPVDYAIKGKVIVLTGAASGIGYETSLLLARQGAYLSVADVNADALKEKAAEIEKVSTGKVMWTAVDVRKDDQVNAWIEKTVKEWGKLDGAVNLAGTYHAPFQKTSSRQSTPIFMCHPDLKPTSTCVLPTSSVLFSLSFKSNASVFSKRKRREN